ncbi:MAG TPA: two-component regulator propeller domain-containing protein, partial [Anaerolineales bacterium]|nr:two-component regulator propeller domain-containing protein [Anaerolineales bacterium]
MKLISNLLVAAAFLFAVQPVAAAHLRRSVSQDHAPGSVVRFEHLTVQDGLSQNSGSVIFQDSRGFLWIGTQDGLNRYDGYSFSVFKHDREDPASISHNSILSIAEDDEGFLWIGTRGGGLNRFDPATETFTVYHNTLENPASLLNDTVTSILYDSKGRLWVGTLNGLDRFNPRTNGFDHFTNIPGDPSSLSSNVISVIFEDSRRRLWIGTGALSMPGSGLNRFNPDTGKVTRFQHNDQDPTSLGSDNISAIYEAPDGNFWIGTGGYDLPGNGLDLFNPRTGTAFHYLHDGDIDDSISGDNISVLWGDTHGTLWIGTWSHGLNRMDFSKSGHFTHYRHDPYFPDSLSANEV